MPFFTERDKTMARTTKNAAARKGASPKAAPRKNPSLALVEPVEAEVSEAVEAVEPQAAVGAQGFRVDEHYPELGAAGGGLMSFGLGYAFGWTLLPITLYSLGASAITYGILKPIVDLIQKLTVAVNSGNNVIKSGNKTIDDANTMLIKLDKKLHKILINEDYEADQKPDLVHLLADVQKTLAQLQNTVKTVNDETLPEVTHTAKNVEEITQRYARFFGGGAGALRDDDLSSSDDDDLDQAPRRRAKSKGSRRRR